MTEKQKQQETQFAKDCMAEKLKEMLESGEIGREAYETQVAKIFAA